MLSEVLEKLEARGHRAAAVPIGRLGELREHYEDVSRRGMLDERVAEDLLKYLSFQPPDGFPNPASLVVIATRDPVVHCTFGWQGTDFTVPVPPTYLHLRRKSEEATQALAELLPQNHVECIINAPHKLLAVRSGLARYGRNNITYISGLGSFYSLTTACTDVLCDTGEWLTPSLMARCEGCTCCADACPTGAIPEGRILLRAELCVTYWNEKPGDVPFPGWLAEDWHNCLVGCLHCQLACPENGVVRDYVESGPRFTQDETEQLLGVSLRADLSEPLKEKLDDWDLLEWVDVLPRNLAVHLSGKGGRAPS